MLERRSVNARPQVFRRSRLPSGRKEHGGGAASLLYLIIGSLKEKTKRTLSRRPGHGYVSSVNDTYHFRAIIAGHIIKLYKYSDLQVCQKGKICKGRQKREDRTEEEKEKDRKKNLLRARNSLIDTINANVDRPWGERLKFFTMSFKDDIFDLKESNREFNKFIKRLEYHIRRKVHYTVIARFQDGKRPGGKVGGRDGVVHYHVLFYDSPMCRMTRLTAIWDRGFRLDQRR